jgi:hypothetical protein
MHNPSEIDTGDQFIDTASQSLVQPRIPGRPAAAGFNWIHLIVHDGYRLISHAAIQLELGGSTRARAPTSRTALRPFCPVHVDDWHRGGNGTSWCLPTAGMESTMEVLLTANVLWLSINFPLPANLNHSGV